MECINEHLDIILNKVVDAVVAIDSKGVITLLNKRAEKLLNLENIDYYKKNIEDVIVGSELRNILVTKKEELNIRFSIEGKELLLDRIPILSNGEIKGAVSVFHDISLISEMAENRSYIDTLDTIIDTFDERVVVVDNNGIITMMSNSYKKFLKNENPEGMHVTDVIENTRLHIVVQTGIEEMGEIQILNGHKAISMRIPIIEDGKVIGAIGKILFRDISELVSLNKKTSNLEIELEHLKSELNKERTAKYSFKSLAGNSNEINEVKKLAMQVSKTDSNVLVNGESGTGKELFVHAIHNASQRRHKAFVKINCAAIPAELLESELFGYEEGAFTGAKKGGKKGKFEVAEGGTLLLDEIGDMPLSMQAKLLRVLQEKEFERVGSNSTVKINVRIIASTNCDLLKLVNEKKFRGDLYYRLNVMNILLPPLRDRIDDIDILSKVLISNIGTRLGIYVEGITEEALNYFKSYNWPGNIRELENILERAINLLDSKFVIEEKHLPLFLTKKKTNKYVRSSQNLKKLIEELEERTIRECLQETGFNKNQTSQILNISRVSLYKKIEKYGIMNTL